ncbi:hypothetical protein HK096_009021 [Nowakowskiella sp. JEL0078]|nr:hypothetical protein HK096_009021 [Nowakowskiella sp. JEL0078]
MGCFGEARWKREEYPDHKFSNVNVHDFVSKSFFTQIRYSFVFLFALKSIMVYMADIAIMCLQFYQLFSTQSDCNSSAAVTNYCINNNAWSASLIPSDTRPWIILASIMLSFVLLFIDWKKAATIIRSQDISYAFTSTIVNRYYVLKSYPHFCFFKAIKDQRNLSDRLAFFVFFAFKGWKRLLLAELPRQILNALSLIDVLVSFRKKAGNSGQIVVKTYTDNQAIDVYISTWVTLFQQSQQNLSVQFPTFLLQTFTVAIWLISFTILLFAFLCYLPLLWKIRGNLKEYCVHKIDKRITELLKKKSDDRSDRETDNFSTVETMYDDKSVRHDNYDNHSQYNRDHRNESPAPYSGTPHYVHPTGPSQNIVMHGSLPLIPVSHPYAQVPPSVASSSVMSKPQGHATSYSQNYENPNVIYVTPEQAQCLLITEQAQCPLIIGQAINRPWAIRRHQAINQQLR